MNPRSRTLVAAILAGIAPAATLGGCAGDLDPLGGPYGGTAATPPPSPEDSSASASGEDGGSDGSEDASSSGAGEDSGLATVPMTWTQIYGAFLAAGKIGNCTDSSCHDYPTPAGLYSYLVSQGQLGVGGTSPPFTNSAVSCLSWYGGDMPLDGAESAPQAVAALNAWAAAGAQDN